MAERFVQLGDTHIKDNWTGKEFYAPSETELLELLNELDSKNKELQYKLRNCEDARKSYKQDWKACSSYCDEYKNKIISLKDEVCGLIEENKELKEKLCELGVSDVKGIDTGLEDWLND